ncbi:methanogenesis marker 8 protein [Methanopyrus sp.]
MTKYEHVMECLGKTPVRVIWKDGNVKVHAEGDPLIERCPLMCRREGFSKLTRETAERHVLNKVNDVGMFTPKRRIRSCRRYTPFGVSETLMTCLQHRLIDAAVIVSDCAGTVVTDKPTIVQGLCGEISGIRDTDPIPEVVDRLEEFGCSVLGKIDQREGVEIALEGRRRFVAVTVADAGDAETIREEFGDDVLIAAVHTTGTDEEDAERLVQYCDIITGCASKTVRRAVGRRYILKAGSQIPVYGITPAGAEALWLNVRELLGDLKLEVRHLG